MPDILTNLDMDKMEMLVGIELQKGFNNFINELESVIAQMQIQGVAEAEIRSVLQADLANGGRLFGMLKNGMKYSVATAIGQASNGASMEVYNQADIKKYKWIAVSLRIGKEPCPDCRPRHGRVETRDYWENVGYPKSGFSVCQRHCKCRLVPESYKGKDLETYLERKEKT